MEEYAAYREDVSSDSVHSSERQQSETIWEARRRVSAECLACITAQDPDITDSARDSGIADEDIWDECTGFMDPSYGPGIQGSRDYFDAGFWKELVYYVYGNGNHYGCIRESTIAGCAVSTLPTSRKLAALPLMAFQRRSVIMARCNLSSHAWQSCVAERQAT